MPRATLICLTCEMLVNRHDVPDNENTASGIIYCRECWKKAKEEMRRKRKADKKRGYDVKISHGNFDVHFP